MKTSLFLAIATLVPGMFLMQASGVSSVAVIDFERIITETPDGKGAITKLRSFGTAQQAAIDQKMQEAETLANRLQVGERALSESAKAQLTRELEAARATVQSMGEEAQNKLLQMQQELLGPVEQRTSAVINTYAATQGLKIVFDSAALRNGLVYVHDTADITTEIIRRVANDLSKPPQANASLEAPGRAFSNRLEQQLMNRTWIAVDFLKANQPKPSRRLAALVGLSQDAQ